MRMEFNYNDPRWRDIRQMSEELEQEKARGELSDKDERMRDEDLEIDMEWLLVDQGVIQPGELYHDDDNAFVKNGGCLDCGGFNECHCEEIEREEGEWMENWKPTREDAKRHNLHIKLSGTPPHEIEPPDRFNTSKTEECICYGKSVAFFSPRGAFWYSFEDETSAEKFQKAFEVK